MTAFKICGLSTPETVDAAAAAGAFALGFVFFPASPRHLEPATAAGLIARVPAGVARVAVLVEPEDALVDAVLAAGIDTLQVHGAVSTARLAALAARPGVALWRAAGVSTRAEIADAVRAAGPAAWLLLDAKPPRGSDLPGGNGVSFDWRLLAGADIARPWGLGGGLHAGNVGEAVRVARPGFVDVSSGVEEEAGVKSVAKIRAFAAMVRA